MKEIWKEIKWFTNYEISSFWRHRKDDIILTLKKTSNWYLSTHLYKEWICNKIRVHRLVWQAFLWLDITDTKMFVCHKDDNPLNNRVDNLFLWTAKDNSQDMVNKWRHGHSWKIWKLNHNSKKVKQYTKSWEFIKEWGSMMDIERELWISHKKVWDVCHYRRKSYWGFIWECSR